MKIRRVAIFKNCLSIVPIILFFMVTIGNHQLQANKYFKKPKIVGKLKEFSEQMEQNLGIGYLPPKYVDDYMHNQNYFIKNTFFKVNGQKLQILKTDLDFQDGYGTLLLITKTYWIKFLGNSNGDILDFEFKIIKNKKKGDHYDLGYPVLHFKKSEYDDKNEFHSIEGKFTFDNKNYYLNIRLNLFNFLGFGDIEVRVEDDIIYLNGGDLGSKTYTKIKDILKNKKIKTLVLENVRGSVNDLINVHTGRLIRSHNITTVVKSDGKIYSGGVDLFASGKNRIVYRGAKVGVHSWCCKEGVTADKLSEDDDAHTSQISYFEEMLGEKNGRDFYFYTLKAAPFDDVYIMKINEIRKYKLGLEIK